MRRIYLCSLKYMYSEVLELYICETNEKNGRMEEWKNGRMEEWKNGREGERGRGVKE